VLFEFFAHQRVDPGDDHERRVITRYAQAYLGGVPHEVIGARGRGKARKQPHRVPQNRVVPQLLQAVLGPDGGGGGNPRDFHVIEIEQRDEVGPGMGLSESAEPDMSHGVPRSHKNICSIPSSIAVRGGGVLNVVVGSILWCLLTAHKGDLLFWHVDQSSDASHRVTPCRPMSR
jgi:hypothetical protein